MKIKGKYILRKIGNETAAVPVSETVLTSNVLILLNGSGSYLWTLLEKGGTEDELAASFCEEYDTDIETAKNDIREFTEYLKNNKVEFE